MTIREALAQIESLIVGSMRPIFFTGQVETDEIGEYILLIICRPEYEKIPVSNRINWVYNLIRTQLPDTHKEFNIIVQTFSPTEMDEYFEHIF